MNNIERTTQPQTVPIVNSTSQAGGAGSLAAPSTQAAPTQQQQQQSGSQRSYAQTTRNSITAPALASGSVPRHGRQPSLNPRGHQPATSSNMASPAIVNSTSTSNGASSEHSRKPSVTIGPQGASGALPNGGLATPAARLNINFGQINDASGSPSIAHSTPYHQQTSSLSAPARDPRLASPAQSPSPIPQPAPSGGRPPSGLPPQSNGLSFGSVSENDGNRPMPAVPQVSQLPGNHMTGPNAHYRRASAQSHHTDHPNVNMGAGRGSYSGGGRGRGYNQGYPAQMPYSPAQGYRPVHGQQRPGPMPPQFQSQVGMGPGSPHMPPRSPGPMGSQPGTPQMHHMNMAGHHQMAYPPPSFPAFQQQLGPQPGQFAMQPPFDPQYGYMQAPYTMPPSYYPHAQPVSPRQFKPGPQGAQMPYMPGPQYNPAASQNMSRTSSQLSERPASSLGGHQTQPSTSSGGNHGLSHAPSHSGSGTPLSAQFTIPSREKKGLVIKNPVGEVVTFDKKAVSPAPAAPAAPTPSSGVSSSAPTPPPHPSTSAHNRTDSKTAKTAEEIKAAFQEQVKEKQEKERIAEEEEAAAAAAAAAAVTTVHADTNTSTKPLGETEASAADIPAVPVGESAETRSVTVVSSDSSKPESDAEPEPKSSSSEKLASSTEAAETEEQRKKREEDEEMERMIAEMEAADREEEEREKAFTEKRRKEAEEKAAQENAAQSEERMKQAEREAEALEEKRMKEKQQGEGESDNAKAEREQLFASLKRPTLGPGAEGESGATTPQSQPEESQVTEAPTSTPAMPSSFVTAPGKSPQSAKPKPAALKLETAKPVEPAQPTPGMRALRSARMLQLQSETVAYPEGIMSPNPALNQSGKRGGRMYDKSFLMQFQDAFKEKPTLDWDQKLRETVGDPNDPPKTARTPNANSRPASQRPPAPTQFQGMGTFGTGSARPMPSNPMGHMGRPGAGGPPFRGPGGAFPIGGAMPVRQSSMGGMAGQGPQGSRGPGRIPSKDSSRRGPAKSRQEQAVEDKKMPLTAKGEVKALEKSGTGWTSSAISGQSNFAVADASGQMPPDMVQRKVKAALNKMTPERFDKIAAQIMEIAAQSRKETDGRTLRQVIALTFEKATDEAHWASMYAKFCKHMLEEMSPEIRDTNVTDRSGNPLVGGPLFRKYLLNRCQDEFERGWTVNLPDKKEGEEGQTEEAAMMSDEYYAAAAAKRRGLGLVQFIGELYKLSMLSIRIMHECFLRLLDFEGTPDEAAIESLVKLLRTVGGQMQQEPQGPGLLNSYFERIDRIVSIPDLGSRMHFMLLDVIDLRRNNWHSKDDAKGPKTIAEIHKEAFEKQQREELERAKQNQRARQGGPMGRDGRNYSGGPMGPPPDYARNQVGTDDLRRLQGRGGSSRQSSQTPSRGLGPTSMLSSRSGSGRTSLGPQGGLLSRGDSSASSSALHSRSASVQAEKKEDEAANKANTNAFSALAAMDGDGSRKTPTSSPPSTKVQPVSSENTASATTTQDSTVAAAAGNET